MCFTEGHQTDILDEEENNLVQHKDQWHREEEQHLSREQEAGGVRAEQAKEAAYVIQELEHMDVLAMVYINQAIIGTSHSSKDESHLMQQAQAHLGQYNFVRMVSSNNTTKGTTIVAAAQQSQ